MSVHTAGAIVVHKINRIISYFEQAGAFTERSARTPEQLGVRTGLIFKRLVNAGVLIETSGKRYYLHRENLAAFRSNRRKRILFFLLIIIVIIAITSLISR